MNNIKYSVQITIEPGLEKQADLIRGDLELIVKSFGQLFYQNSIQKIIVTANMEQKLAELEGKDPCFSSRKQLPVAKWVELPDEKILLIAPHIYLLDMVFQCRFHIYIHEMRHLLNRLQKSSYEELAAVDFSVFMNLWIIYDEYSAERWAYELSENTFDVKSKKYIKFVLNGVKDKFLSLVDDDRLYSALNNEINQYFLNGDRDDFFSKYLHPFDETIKSICYLFAAMDSHDKLYRLSKGLSQSKLVNKNTILLMDFIKEQYLSDDLFLDDGFDLMDEVMDDLGLGNNGYFWDIHTI